MSLNEPLQLALDGGEAAPITGLPKGLQEFYGVDVLFTDDLQVTPAGDWALVAGIRNVRLALRRRLLVKPGEFALRPDYGAGVGLYLKKGRSQAQMDRLRHAIETQVAKETRLEKTVTTVEPFIQNEQTGIRVTVTGKLLKHNVTIPLSFVEGAV